MQMYLDNKLQGNTDPTVKKGIKQVWYLNLPIITNKKEDILANKKNLCLVFSIIRWQ